MEGISFLIRPAAPFRLDMTAWALRRRPNNIVDRWDIETYRRAFVVEGHPIEVAVQQEGNADEAKLNVKIIGRHLKSNTKSEVTMILERSLGLKKDLSTFYRFAAEDKKLRVLVDRFRGLKPLVFQRCSRPCSTESHASKSR